MDNIIKIHSFESLAALDGPGLRLAVFLTGCPLRCAYCHNPDTWASEKYIPFTENQLMEKILRYRTYFKNNGGVTFTGGEPLLQAQELLPVVEKLKKENIHIVFDTAGSVANPAVEEILSHRPMLLTDIKMPDEERYKKYIKGSLATTLKFLDMAQQNNCETWLRYVVVPGINDSADDIKKIVTLANRYTCVKKVSLLAYHTMGLEKYNQLGLEYTLKHVKAPTQKHMQQLQEIVDRYFSGQEN